MNAYLVQSKNFEYCGIKDYEGSRNMVKCGIKEYKNLSWL